MRVNDRKVELTSWKFSKRVEVNLCYTTYINLLDVDSSPIYMHYQYLPTVLMNLFHTLPQRSTSSAKATYSYSCSY
jgi:hypothetical protein